MKRIWWCLLWWPWVVWATPEPSASQQFQWSGWVSKAWIKTDPEPLRVPQKEPGGWEAALRLDWVIQPWLAFRALYAHLPYLEDGPDSEFEFLLLDANTYLGESIVGTRLGRLQLPYGFYNMQRLNPADRLGIHHAQPMQIYWGQNAALFDRGDGWVVYYNSPRNSKFQGTLEFGRITRENPQPQGDYLFGLEDLDIYFDRLETPFISLELEFYETLRLRKDHLEPVQYLQVPPSHYQKLALLGAINAKEIPPGTLWEELTGVEQDQFQQLLALEIPTQPTGEFTRPYVLDYDGIEVWWANWQLTLEQARFYYTGEGSQREYYFAVEGDDALYNGLEKRVDTHRSGVLAFHAEQLMVHVGYGFWYVDRERDPVRDYGGTHRYGGIKYQPSQEWTLKYEVHNKSGYFGLRYSQNKKLLDQSGSEWNMQAIAVTYEF